MGISRNIRYIKRRIKRVGKLENEYKSNHIKTVGTFDFQKIKFNSSNNPLVTIIIPFYNEINYTQNCLYYLYKNISDRYSYEIILIDDNSTQIYDFSNFEGITVIKNESNLGFLKNINKGILASKGEYIYLLNNDTEVQKYFLDELFYVFENFKNVGAVGSMLLNSNKSLQEAGSVFMKNCDINQIVRKKLPFYPEVNFISKVDYCSGCSLLFKKYDDNNDINLFDEQFAPAYFEETDLCFQLKYFQNKNIYYTPFSKVIHYNGVTYNSKTEDNTEKLQKKETLFKTNLEKFKNKWKIQLNAIQATTIPDRIQEIYNKKSVVVFAGMIPEFDKDSGSNRLKEILDSFCELGYYVVLIVKFAYLDNPYIEYFERKGVNVFYEHKKYSSIEKYIEKQKFNPNLVWFYSPDIFIKYYKTAKKYFPNSKLIYDMVDIHHLRIERAIELDPKRISLKRKYKKYLKSETLSAKLATYVIAISEFDKIYMSKICDESKIKIISNIHYPKIPFEKTLPFKERKDILFIGSTHTPNIDAVYFLYNEIMSIVWKSIPNLKVNIIGNLADEIKDINNDNFIFKGYVPNIDTYFISNKLMVAPLRYGAGVKGKIGQAFEYYLPVVTSSIGAEGMHLKNNINALIEDSAQGFANAIIELYENEKLWLTLQQNSEKSLFPFSKQHLKEIINQL